MVALLDDASDFSFENAKACHAVVLTTVEHDKLSWQDTDQLDRLRRQHAQQHPAPQVSNVGATPKVSNSQEYSREMICKYFTEGSCSKGPSHVTKGVLYKHICHKCGDTHRTKNCKPKN